MINNNSNEDEHLEILKSLGKIARDIPLFSNVRIVAGVYRRNKLISVGYNQNKTHPLQLEFNKWDNPEKVFLHAEMDAIIKAKRCGEDLEGCDIYVTRILKDNSLALSRPCCGCNSAINYYGINSIFYSIKDNEYGTILARN